MELKTIIYEKQIHKNILTARMVTLCTCYLVEIIKICTD